MAQSKAGKMDRKPADECFRDSNSSEMLEKLHKLFGLDEFRVNQLEAIDATIRRKDVFVVGGNGSGKSLCYQLPACLSAGVTVVISPLKSLILDQIQKLTRLGIEARTLSGDQGQSDEDSIYDELSETDPLLIKLLYVTPEKVSMSGRLMDALQTLLSRGLLVRFAIDEAHCISQWGYDFRRDYTKLHELRQTFPGVPMIALSALNTPDVQEDILRELQMTKPQVFTMSFNQNNLKYAVLPKQDVEQQCITWIKEHYPRDSGIVYCLKRDECVSMAKSLRKAGLLASPYHAWMSDEDRESVQNKWKDGNDCQVICATIAFGMGIDKPDVRYVIHATLPRSMGRYYRETGRAGRDGDVSHCILFYSCGDVNSYNYVINDDDKMDEDSKRRDLDNLQSMSEYCENLRDCRRTQLLSYFGEVDIETNLCEENAKAICDNCARANQSKV